ncbi:DUF1674 domain-containing protein [Methylomagnum ishizawai]|uniref:DUF1674 domain-containing protein n=1 Tax=Methylomagnum ishizawai TaxID=1760988 RepID=UPI001C33165B|nr:DUF1674 domain-containing protein [Methylomagnum ishizawai]BBL75320.1 hypothetical protein MishRS11D_24180 [Methylomagnum ishizawai]
MAPESESPPTDGDPVPDRAAARPPEPAPRPTQPAPPPDPTRYGDWQVGGRCIDF